MWPRALLGGAVQRGASGPVGGRAVCRFASAANAPHTPPRRNGQGLPPAPRASASAGKHVRLLRSGLSARDVEQVWDAWHALDERNELASLKRHDDADVLALVRAHLAVLAPRSSRDVVQFPLNDTRSDAWRERCMAWGLHTARRMDVLGVLGWMKVELMCGNAPGGVALFHAYLGHRRDAAAHGEGDVLYLDSDVRRRPLHDTLELLVLCYAQTGDLHALVSVMQSFDVGKHTELYFDLAHFRRQCTKFPWTHAGLPETTALQEVRARALDWVSHAELARGGLDGRGGAGGPNRIARLLGSMLSRGDLVAFWRLFRTAMDAGVFPGTDTRHAWLAQAQLAADGQLPLWTDSCWSVCLGGLLAAKRTDLAAHVWGALAEVQAAVQKKQADWPPLPIWNALLDGYSRAGDYAAVEAVWRVLTDASASTRTLPLAQGVARTLQRPPLLAPDLVCYTTMIAASFRLERPDAALDLFRALQAREARGELSIPVETYNAVVHGLCYVYRMDEALALVNSMGTGSIPKPTMTTLNGLLRTQARVRDLGGMAKTLRSILPLGLRPDVITFTTVLDALLRASDTPERAEAAVQQVIHMMESMDVQPNSVTFTSMIKACLSTRASGPSETQPRLQMALQLLHTMHTTKMAPNAVTYATILPAVLANGPLLATLAKQRKLPPVFLRAPHGYSPRTFERDLPAEAPTAGLRIALTLWNHMRAAHITPPPELYEAMLKALWSHANNPTALEAGARLADELLHANGALAPAAPVHDTTAPPPNAKNWTLVLRAALHAYQAASGACADACRTFIAALLKHMHTSAHGTAALQADTSNVAQIVEEAQRVLTS